MNLIFSPSRAVPMCHSRREPITRPAHRLVVRHLGHKISSSHAIPLGSGNWHHPNDNALEQQREQN